MNDDTKETVTSRMQRIREPHRTNLFNLVEQRMREATNHLGPRATTEARMVEMYLLGVNDGSKMQKKVTPP